MRIADEIKSRKFENDRNMAMVNLFYTANWFRDLHKIIFKKHSLLPQHYNVLRIINGKYPEAISPGEIKEVMLDKAPDVTRLVDKLVDMQLVDRCQKEENKRIIQIRTSEKGIDILCQMTTEVNKMINQEFGLNDEEATALSDLLDKARSH